MNNFKNKVALVTGGSSGMGAATADLLAKKGAKVFCAQRTKSLHEDILTDLFTMSSNLFKFAELEPQKLEKIRLKSKKVVKSSDVHEVSFGTKDKKYWFTADQISQILDPEINTKQISNLTSEQIKEFNSIAEHQISEFGYKKIAFHT